MLYVAYLEPKNTYATLLSRLKYLREYYYSMAYTNQVQTVK